MGEFKSVREISYMLNTKSVFAQEAEFMMLKNLLPQADQADPCEAIHVCTRM